MRSRPLWLAVLVVLVASVDVLAFTPRAGDAVVITEPVADDLYAAGGSIEVSAPIDGDLVAAGGTITVSGAVSGAVLVGGGTVRIGAVGRSVRAAGGKVTLDGRVGTDALLAGGTVGVERGAAISRDLVATGGTVRVDGAVGRRAFLSGGTVIIGGRIEGNVTVDAEQLTVLPSARISGRLSYAAARADVQSGAQITGGTERRPYTRSRPVVRPFPFRLAWRFVEALWLIVMGLIALVIAPRAMTRVAGRIGEAFGYSLLTGFILLVVIPVAAILVAVTVVGIPVAGVLMLLYGASLITAQIFPAAWLGRWALIRSTRSGAAAPSPYLAQILGTLILVLAVALPLIGWLVRLLALLLGLGALWAAIWAARERSMMGGPAAPAAPASGPAA